MQSKMSSLRLSLPGREGLMSVKSKTVTVLNGGGGGGNEFLARAGAGAGQDVGR